MAAGGSVIIASKIQLRAHSWRNIASLYVYWDQENKEWAPSRVDMCTLQIFIIIIIIIKYSEMLL